MTTACSFAAWRFNDAFERHDAIRRVHVDLVRLHRVVGRELGLHRGRDARIRLRAGDRHDQPGSRE